MGWALVRVRGGDRLSAPDMVGPPARGGYGIEPLPGGLKIACQFDKFVRLELLGATS